jgi:hypothetical protein
MSATSVEGGFSVVDTAMLNRFFRDYFRRHGQGGTNAQQRNLRHLFNFLQREEGLPHPYTDDLHRYTEVKHQPTRRRADTWPSLSHEAAGSMPPCSKPPALTTALTMIPTSSWISESS